MEALYITWYGNLIPDPTHLSELESLLYPGSLVKGNFLTENGRLLDNIFQREAYFKLLDYKTIEDCLKRCYGESAMKVLSYNVCRLEDTN